MTATQEVSEVGISDRRAVPRRQCAPKDVVLWLDSETPLNGIVVDESLRGVGLEFFEPLELELNQKVTISYNGVRLDAQVRHSGTTSSGNSRVGFEWTAEGLQQAKPFAANSTAEFVETLPCGLFVTLEFFEHEKWAELGDTVERLQDLASRCGITAINEPLTQLLMIVDGPNPREPSRKALNVLIDRCQRLKNSISRISEQDGNAVEDMAEEDMRDGDEPAAFSVHDPDHADGPASNEQNRVEDTELVTSLLRSLGKTTSEITIQSLADALRGVIPSVPQNLIDNVFDQLLDGLHASQDAFMSQSLSGTLGAVAERLPSENAEDAFQRIATSLQRFTGTPIAENLSAALNSVAERLPTSAAERILERIISSLENGPEVEQETLSCVLGTVAEKVSVDACARIAPRLVDTIQRSDSESVRRTLTQTLQVLTDKLAPQDIQNIFYQVVFALEQTDDEYTLQCLAEILSSTTDRLPGI